MKLFRIYLCLLGGIYPCMAQQCTSQILGRTKQRLPSTDTNNFVQQEIPANTVHQQCDYTQGGVTITYPLDWFASTPNVKVGLEALSGEDPTVQYTAQITANSATSCVIHVVKNITTESCSAQGQCSGLNACNTAPSCSSGVCISSIAGQECDTTCDGPCDNTCYGCNGSTCTSQCLSCGGSCDGQCDGGGTGCNGFGSCNGVCEGQCNNCSSGICTGTPSGNICYGTCSLCSSTCFGSCSGIFTGICYGETTTCNGTCLGVGSCATDGTCNGSATCTACNGRGLGTGTCLGSLDGICALVNGGQCQGICSNCNSGCSVPLDGTVCNAICTNCIGSCVGRVSSGGICSGTATGDCFASGVGGGSWQGNCATCNGICSGSGNNDGGACLRSCNNNSSQEADDGDVRIHVYVIENPAL